jgi:hypothetical protein
MYKCLANNLLFLTFCSSLFANNIQTEEPVWLRWNDSELWEDSKNTRVTIRGFCYPTSTDAWILSAQPDLKTCCVGASKELHHQILIVSGPILQTLKNQSPGQVIQVIGFFRIQPAYASQGELSQLYIFTDADLVEMPGRHWQPWVVTALVLAFFAIAARYYTYVKGNSL